MRARRAASPPITRAAVARAAPPLARRSVAFASRATSFGRPLFPEASFPKAPFPQAPFPKAPSPKAPSPRASFAGDLPPGPFATSASLPTSPASSAGSFVRLASMDARRPAACDDIAVSSIVRHPFAPEPARRARYCARRDHARSDARRLESMRPPRGIRPRSVKSRACPVATRAARAVFERTPRSSTGCPQRRPARISAREPRVPHLRRDEGLRSRMRRKRRRPTCRRRTHSRSSRAPAARRACHRRSSGRR